MSARHPAPGAPPLERWEDEVGRRRAASVAAAAVRLCRAGAGTVELSRALLPTLRGLSDRQCLILEGELDAAFARLHEE